MKLILTSFLLIFITSSFAQDRQDKERIKQVDKFATANFKKYSPGCAILIAKKGEVIYEKGFGIANLELNVPMKPEMVFRIGSITKQFTSIAILQLVEKGKISLSDSIQKYINNYHFKGKTITIENLLTHTSGIKGYEQIDAKVPNAIRIDFAPALIIDSLDKLSLDFDPGTKYSYSNSNYFLLGYIIEKVTGKSYQQYLKENIFNTIELNSTYYESDTEIIPNRAKGYTFSDSSYWNSGFISMSTVYSAGALLSTVNDLFKWHQGLYSGQLLKNETLQKAFTKYKLADGKLSDYGYGFFIQKDNGFTTIGHGGAIDGFRAMEIYYPEQELFITLLMNSEPDNYMNFFDAISKLALGKSIEPTYKDLFVADTTLNSYIGIYIFFEDKKQTLKVYRKDNRLYAELSNGTGYNMALLAQSDTLFYLPDVRRIPTTIEFIITNGKVTGLYWTQEQKHEASRNE